MPTNPLKDNGYTPSVVKLTSAVVETTWISNNTSVKSIPGVKLTINFFVSFPITIQHHLKYDSFTIYKLYVRIQSIQFILKLPILISTLVYRDRDEWKIQHLSLTGKAIGTQKQASSRRWCDLVLRSRITVEVCDPRAAKSWYIRDFFTPVFFYFLLLHLFLLFFIVSNLKSILSV